jgi:hypothetical protein
MTYAEYVIMIETWLKKMRPCWPANIFLWGQQKYLVDVRNIF